MAQQARLPPAVWFIRGLLAAQIALYLWQNKMPNLKDHPHPGEKLKETYLRTNFHGQSSGRILTPRESTCIFIIAMPDGHHEGPWKSR